MKLSLSERRVHTPETGPLGVRRDVVATYYASGATFAGKPFTPLLAKRISRGAVELAGSFGCPFRFFRPMGVCRPGCGRFRGGGGGGAARPA